jgi:ribosomal protein S8
MPKETKQPEETEFDSTEELMFSHYLDELYEAGYIESWEHHPESFILCPPVFYECDKQLKTKTKVLVKKFMAKHGYTADFKIIWNFDTLDSRIDLKKSLFVANTKRNTAYYSIIDYYSIIEVKPAFSLFNSQREFAINQKWLYDSHRIYAQKIIPINKKKTGLFQISFCPKKFLYTEKTKKLKKLNFAAKTLEEFVEERGNL